MKHHSSTYAKFGYSYGEKSEEAVKDKLLDLGFAVDTHSRIVNTRGYWSHIAQDCDIRWEYTCWKDNQKVRLYCHENVSWCAKRKLAATPAPDFGPCSYLIECDKDQPR